MARFSVATPGGGDDASDPNHVGEESPTRESKQVYQSSSFEIKLPGWGRPLTCYDGEYDSVETDEMDEEIFDTSEYWRQQRLTSVEVLMIHILNQLTDKANWQEKLRDDKIWARWANEAKFIILNFITNWDYNANIELDQGPLTSLGSPARDSTMSSESATAIPSEEILCNPEMLDAVVDFLFKELQHKAQVLEEFNYTTILGFGSADIVKTDTLVPTEFRARLNQQLAVLETDPRRGVDWHPGQEGVVRNLVHPSLYPLRYGQSRILTSEDVPLATCFTFTGAGTTLPAQKEAVHDAGYSNRFQWLPSEIRFLPTGLGNKVQFTSYINNLEWPRYKTLYGTIEELIGYALPLWNKCLATKIASIPRRILCEEDGMTWGEPKDGRPETPPVFTDGNGVIHDLEESLRSCIALGFHPQTAKNEHGNAWEAMREFRHWPGPMPYDTWREGVEEALPINLADGYRTEGLQIIVKIASIHLTSENPMYTGGSWHVEGLANEHICATAIYYYDSENITDSKLGFRAGASLSDRTVYYNQHEYKGLQRVYGTQLGLEEASQDLAALSTPAGRLLVFPNVFQHCLEPFELADKTLPGHRKMVVLWLINPDRRIISTANVGPQQKEQYQRIVRSICRAKDLPGDIEEMIVRVNSGHLPSEDEARAARLELMEERSVPGAYYGSISGDYNFCEH